MSHDTIEVVCEADSTERRTFRVLGSRIEVRTLDRRSSIKGLGTIVNERGQPVNFLGNNRYQDVASGKTYKTI